MAPESDEYHIVLKALLGHALCEVRLARATLMSRLTVSLVLRRMVDILKVDDARVCEACGTTVDVYGVVAPPTGRSS